MIPKKKWFIKVGGEEQGPFSKRELRGRGSVTPDTWARREDWREWKKIRDIPELQDLFQEECPQEKIEPKMGEGPLGEIALDVQQEPPYFTLWLIVALVLILYFLLKKEGIL